VREVWDELARFGSATVYEASSRRGLVDADLVQVVPGSSVAGPARTVRCGQDDNLMAHAVLAHVRPGDVVILTMPTPSAVALIGDLLATQAKAQGVAGLLVDAAVRDVDELRTLGLPIWARFIRVRGAAKDAVGEIDTAVVVGGTVINPEDVVVMDADGAVVVEKHRLGDVLVAARERVVWEDAKRVRLMGGELSYDLDGLRSRVEGGEARRL
jgi:4-hydroxy-4-methyl-2-oxoglutarate aldolase